MDTCGVFNLLDNAAFPGGTLSVEERSALQASFVLLKEANHFTEVRFWGKVSGTQQDYFICQGTISEGKVAPFDCPRATFKSTDGVVWTPLADVDGAMRAKCEAIDELFTGDLSKQHGVAEGEEAGDDAVTEEKRLAALVQAVDENCSVIPKGALLLDARHRVVPSPSFKGVSAECAMDTSSYVHWRVPTQADKKKAFETKGLSQTSDFLDDLSKDEPTGCWSLIFEPAGCMVTLRSNVYPGAVAFASVSGPGYGNIYFGNGLRNNDIAFMLPKC